MPVVAIIDAAAIAKAFGETDVDADQAHAVDDANGLRLLKYQ